MQYRLSNYKMAVAATVLLCIAGALLPGATGVIMRDLLWSTAGMLLLYFACRGCFATYRRAVTSTDRLAPPQFADAFLATIQALASAIAAKDSYSDHDSSRVQRICELIALQMGQDHNQIQGIRLAAMLRDVGKLGIPDHILLKPGPLDSDEYARMQNHAAIGAKILEQINYPWDVARMINHHHEKYDGTGYPDGLAGEDIPLGSRIISVAEVYDALISERCYRKGWSHLEAVDYIEKLSGTQFDPQVVRAFLQLEPIIGAISQPDQCADSTKPSSRSSYAAAEVIAQANRELMSLFEMAQTLSSTLEIDEVVALLAHRTRRLTQAATCVVMLKDNSNPEALIAKTAIGRYQEIMRTASARIGKGMTGKAALRQSTTRGSFDPQDLTYQNGHCPADFKSCAVTPITSLGEVLGTINIYDVMPNAFDEDDVHMLAFVAHQAALAIENARAFEKIRDSAMRDSLTNLHNGRYLRAYLERKMSHATRLGDPVSVVGIDLDDFKNINDTLGHQTGDRVLKEVANIFRQHLRDYDLAVRTGGDEFVVILPSTPAAEAHRIAERIQNQIQEYAKRITEEGSGRFGASIGVASYPEDADDPETLLARADAAMYRDKRARKQGRLAA